MSNPNSPRIPFYIRRKVVELRNIFKLILPFCHIPRELPGVPKMPVWGLMPWVPVTCHPAVPTNLFHFWWLFLLQPAGLGMEDTVGHCGTVKVNSGIFESTNVLIDLPPAAPNFSAVCFAALSASQFPRVCGVSSFW